MENEEKESSVAQAKNISKTETESTWQMIQNS